MHLSGFPYILFYHFWRGFQQEGLGISSLIELGKVPITPASFISNSASSKAEFSSIHVTLNILNIQFFLHFFPYFQEVFKAFKMQAIFMEYVILVASQEVQRCFLSTPVFCFQRLLRSSPCILLSFLFPCRTSLCPCSLCLLNTDSPSFLEWL